jgi:glycine cleavage system H protein
MDPKKIRYAKTHEWAAIEKDVVVVGITKFAVEQLTDVVFVDLPDVGDHTFACESFGEIESVKAVSDLYAPIEGEITEVNKKVMDDPKILSDDPYGKGWLIKIKPEPPTKPSVDHLMTVEQYEKQISENPH